MHHLEWNTKKVGNFFNFPQFYFNITHVLPQNVGFRNLGRLKRLIGQTRHGTVYTAFFNIDFVEKGKSYRKYDFPIFRDFSPISVRFASKRGFLQPQINCIFDMSYKTLNSTLCINYASFRKKNYNGNEIFQFSMI